MSYRISRVMGYGMPWSEFKELCRLDISETGYELDVIHDRLKAMGDAGLTVPDDVYRENWYGQPHGGARRSTILEKRLLATHFTNGGRKPAEIGDPQDLVAVVMNPDHVTDIVFFPNLSYRRSWHKRDGDLDYAFEQYRDGGDGQGEPRDFTTYMRFGPYPFTNDLMLADGTPVKWDHYERVQAHPEWLAAPPAEVRWWLPASGILDEAGVNRLRPLIAQYWC